MSKPKQYDNVRIDKLVHGGQGLGALPDGKKVLVWNTLPGEVVSFMSQKSRSSYIEGIATDIIEASTKRAIPRDDLYLSTSPWQMMSYEAENRYKRDILIETLQRADVDYDGPIELYAPNEPWQYRNKMEYSFWGDDDGLHLALYNRGTHRKQIVTGSSIARPEIDRTANAICANLNQAGIRAGDLKSLIVRCNQAGECVAALFTRNEKLLQIAELGDVCKGVVVYFSNPKSPASVATRKLYEFGEVTLQDELLGQVIQYDVLSFFQINLEIYQKALTEIKAAVGNNFVTDMYAGVGSIGLTVSAQAPWLVELDPHSVEMAKINAAASEFTDVKVVHASSESATENITCDDDSTVIFDPPRAGLHSKVIEATEGICPGHIVYLSCNPSTLARDLEKLQDTYKIERISGYNFFPRTPHIEALAILRRR